jgi:hypothetical protein
MADETKQLSTYVVEGRGLTGDPHRFRMGSVTEEYQARDEKDATQKAKDAGINPVIRVRLKTGQ